ncbi:MAG TPA: hypothetical protein PK202_03900 [Verrucomicrobiota bacterium]|nr:hypothetical protein [Verrucomicrobiota bacterium]HOX61988.1 hypothetical protein [Verrucomicrobiota bacterium]HPI64434.1 hypothetical protein [Verrucomicrobiota bacterium]
MLLHRAVLGRNFGGCAEKSWQRFVLRRGFTVLLGADNSAVKVETFRKQRAIPQPDSVSSAEFAAHGGHLHLKLAVVVPSPLETRAAGHFVFAQQPTLFIPLPANPVQQAVLVGLFGGEPPALVPGSVQTMPATISQAEFLAKQPGSIKVSLNGGVHHAFSASDRQPHRPALCAIKHALAGQNQRFYHNDGRLPSRQVEANRVSTPLWGFLGSDQRQFPAMKT